MNEPRAPSMPESCRAALQWALADLERCWDAGTHVRVETYLEKDPILRDHVDAILDLIYQEVLVRSRAGEHPELEEYVQRFPALAEALRCIFEVHRAVEGTAVAARRRYRERRALRLFPGSVSNHLPYSPTCRATKSSNVSAKGAWASFTRPGRRVWAGSWHSR